MNLVEVKKPKIKLPKVLIAIPTYEGKNYCLEPFLEKLSEKTGK